MNKSGKWPERDWNPRPPDCDFLMKIEKQHQTNQNRKKMRIFCKLQPLPLLASFSNPCAVFVYPLDNPLDPKDTGSESDDPVIMDKVSWILLGVSIAVLVAMVTASAWLCMKMRKLKMSSRTNARGARHNIESLRARYDVQNEYVVVPDFN